MTLTSRQVARGRAIEPEDSASLSISSLEASRYWIQSSWLVACPLCAAPLRRPLFSAEPSIVQYSICSLIEQSLGNVRELMRPVCACAFVRDTLRLQTQSGVNELTREWNISYWKANTSRTLQYILFALLCYVYEFEMHIINTWINTWRHPHSLDALVPRNSADSTQHNTTNAN